MHRLNFILHTNAFVIFSLYACTILIPGILYYGQLISFSLFKISPTGNGLFTILWLYILGSNLFRHVPRDTTLSVNLFRAVCLVTFMITLLRPFLFSSIDTIFFILETTLTVYLIYFTSRAIVSIECEQDQPLSTFLGVMISIWIFPVGIWFIQPRIQKIFKNIDQ